MEVDVIYAGQCIVGLTSMDWLGEADDVAE